MDLSNLDSIIEELEKKSVRPGSPPELIPDLGWGIWRTSRMGFRVFLKLENKDSKVPGEVLIGPPGFVGHKLTDIPSDVWENITPRHTTAEFKGIKVASNGVDTLKQAIRSSLKADDTRNKALDSLNTPLELVPISRSAGFSDEEIKQALKGVSPNKPPKSSTSEKLPDNVVRLKPRPAPDKEKPSGRKPESNVIPLRPESTANSPSKVPSKETIDHNQTQLEGALALKPSQLKDQGATSREKGMAKFLEDVVAKNIKDDALLKQRVVNLANGLRAGKYSALEVQEEVREITQNYAHVKKNVLKPSQQQALKDSAEVKEFIDTFETKLDEKINESIDRAQGKFKPKEKEKEKEKSTKEVSDSRIKELAEERRTESDRAVRESEAQRAEAERMRERASVDRQQAQEFMSEAQKARMQIDSAIALLGELAGKVKNPEIKKEIKHVIESASVSPFSKRSILLRLYQLLQILLLLVPGL